MRLLRFGERGHERPGLMDHADVIHDMSSIVHDWAGEALHPDNLANVARADLAKLPKVDANVRLGPCVGGTRHFVAVGLNYRDHADESKMAIPAEPLLFNKAPSCIAGPADELPIPPDASQLDWEVELALVIGKRGVQIDEADALSHLAGICVCNDFSERRWQLGGTGQWLKGKSAQGFGPIGPWLETDAGKIVAADLALALDVNDEPMQRGSTCNMVYPPATLISYVSKFMVLEPGDIITTGTPAGVGMGRSPQRFLQRGDVVRARIDGLGEQVTTIC